MKTTTTTIHTLKIDYIKALKRFVECNNDIILDLVIDCTEEICTHLQNYTDAMKNFRDYKIKNVCGDGYTMMLLNDEEMDFVDSFFARDPENEDIQIKVVREGDVVEIISSDYLQY